MLLGPAGAEAWAAPHWSEGGTPGAGAADEIERFVRAAVAGLRPDPGEAVTTGPGRPRVLPALALWAGLLVGVLRGAGGQRGVWRLLAVRGLWDYPRFPVTDEAVRQRLAAGGTAALVALFRRISAALAARLAPFADATLAPFAAEVVALDSTTLDPLARRLPALRGLSARERLPGKVAGRFDLRRQQWQHVAHVEDARENDKVAARALLAGLPPGSLVLADLGYFSFPWLDDLTAGGYYYVSRLRAKTSYEVAHAFFRRGDTFDGLVRLGKHRADRAEHAVRLVQFRHSGVLYRYITNVLDPTLLPLYEVARLYARRWDFELAVKLVKRHLGLHLFWSATPVVVQQQVWATLCIAQILHALHLEVAGRAGVDPFEVSLALLVEYFPQLARDGHDPVAFFVEHGRRAGFIRPSTRTRIRAPRIPPEALAPLPPDLALVRPARYARRKCAPRAAAAPEASVHK
jgi:Transposase DDE domain